MSDLAFPVPVDAASRRVGVLVVNLGTPDAPEPAAVKRYLGEFLSDRRVVEIPPIAWQPILRGIILNVRPRKSARAYREVWMEGGSPLAVYTRDTAQALAQRLAPEVIVDWAMRYGTPAIEERIKALQAAGCDRILIAPLYPQYCAATTATANDAAFAALSRMRAQPTLRTLPPYYDDPAYIAAIAGLVQRQLAALDFIPEVLIASFHGMPQRTRKKGDPYFHHCMETTRLLTEALGRPVQATFQSRFGSEKWLEPATDSVLRELPQKGVKSVAVFTPGFSADCLETLEEIAIRGRDDFMAEKGEKFAFLHCLNAEAEAITLYTELLRRELAGWCNITV
ncbi:ferrochelatase [Sphingobium sp. H39-3-25]|uniref:ferrochelatase n=1 Tax=Sphingobium arseniciresistens TaxID=3030834 RepID=UPI0023B96894|nr:ferrochelatase [Sphingobium arseniciresistens]